MYADSALQQRQRLQSGRGIIQSQAKDLKLVSDGD